MANRGKDSEALGDYEREWLVFGNSCYYPEGGITDLVGRYPNYKKAKDRFDRWLVNPTKPPRVKQNHWTGRSEDCWAQLVVYVRGLGFITLETCVSHYNWIDKSRTIEKVEE